ncbi:hypothetical protein QZM48_34905, partial [Burkholderia orbicola]|nr:hypothetical protein [Burkholderia orbicola]
AGRSPARRPARSICNSAANRIRNPFKHCPGRQSEALFNSLLGDDPHVTARYLRYEPDAARYLALGDFAFWALEIERLRYIGGFGRMGWVDGTQLDTLPPLAFDDEQALWHAYEAGDAHRDGLDLLGVDRHGADWRCDGRRVRTPFESPSADTGALRERLIACAKDVT